MICHETYGNYGDSVTLPSLSENQQQQLEKWQKEYKSLRDDLPSVRNAAAEQLGFEALAQPFGQLRTNNLQATLAQGETLMLLLEVSHKGRGQQGALLIYRDRKPHWVDLAGLSSLANMLQLFSHVLGNRQGFRRGGETKEIATLSDEQLAQFWPKLEGVLGETLWQPLEPYLQQTQRLLSITHGLLHLLPLELSKPNVITLCHYPGLVFYARLRGLVGRVASETESNIKLGLVGYRGDNPKRHIPFAETEAALLNTLWQDQIANEAPQRPVVLESCTGTIEYLHCACHGDRDPRYPETVALLIGPKKLVTMHTLLANRQLRLRFVFLSACLGGFTREDLNGNPAGLVSACFMGGAQVVVASLISVPDLWMPVLALLTAQARLRQELPPETALNEAKRRLRSGDWYKDTSSGSGDSTETLLRKHLKPDHINFYVKPKLEGYKQIIARTKPLARQRVLRAELIKICRGFVIPESTIDTLLQDYFTTSTPADAIERMTTTCGEHFVEDFLNNRIPPQPVLGTLLYGVCAFGETLSD